MRVPEVFGETQAIIFMVVVLPAPFGPRNPKTSPFFTEKAIPSTAMVLPKVFFKSFASMMPGIASRSLASCSVYNHKNPHAGKVERYRKK
jgi:hypothetical protein